MTGFPPQMMATNSSLVAGFLMVWGLNQSGSLGLGNTVARSSPVQLGSNKWIAASMTRSHTVAIRDDRTAWVWGANHVGQLGLNDVVARSSPVQLGSRADWESCHAVASNMQAIFLISTSGEVWMAGSDVPFTATSGSLRSSPVQIGGVWSEVSVGVDSVVMRKADGTLWTWGAFDMNGLTNATITSQGPSIVSPGDTVTGLTSGVVFDVWSTVSSSGNPASNTYAATYRATNIVGNYTPNELVSPTGKLTDLRIFSPTWTSSPIQTGNGALDWTRLFQTGNRTVGGISGGAVYVWGLNAGAVGLSTISPSPIYYSFPSSFSGSWEDIVYASSAGAIGLHDDGTLWTWGASANGEGGHNNVTTSSSPVQVGAATSWAAIGGGGTLRMAKTVSGAVFVWGANTNGQLGLNLPVAQNRSSPVQLGTFNADTILVPTTDGFNAGLIVPT